MKKIEYGQTITLTKDNYVIGEDIPADKYDIVMVQDYGKVITSDNSGITHLNENEDIEEQFIKSILNER